MTKKYSDKDLINQLKSPGWRLEDEKPDNAVTGTLGDVLAESHVRKSTGRKPGIIKKIETEVELDMLQIELLWHELGLPTI